MVTHDYSAPYESAIAARLASLESELDAMRETQYAPIKMDKGSACSCCRPGLIVAADLLYIQPKRGGLDFAIADPNTDDNVQGPVQSIELESNAGVRGSIGYRTVSGWEIAFTYTHFDTDADWSVTEPAGGQLWLTRSAPGSFNNDADTAFATAGLDYDLFDLEAGYTIHPAQCLPVRLFGGFRGATIEETFGVRYAGGTVVGERIQHQSTQVDAYGLRAGAETQWQLGYGLSVFGRAAGSVLMGDFSITDIEDERDFAGQGDVAVTYHYSDVVPVLDAAAGVSWQTGRMTWQLGYEMTAFFNLDQRVNFTGAETINRGQMTNVGNDLGLEGMFVRAVYSR
jgi:hypothetical protein